MLNNSPFELERFEGSQLVFCERFDEKSDIWNLEQHKHSFMELIYFLNGGAKVHGEKDDLILSVYDIVIYPEEFVHQEDVNLAHHQEIICLGIKLPKPSGLEHIRRLTDIDSRLRWLFLEIHAQSESRYKWKSTVIDHLVALLLHYLNMNLNTTVEEQDPINRVIQYMHKNLASRISVDELAAMSNYSPSYLDRQFKKRTGMTPIKFLDELRLKAAGNLLLRRDLDISQVANLIGYDDPKYFSRRFTARFGQPPSQFRKRLLR